MQADRATLSNQTHVSYGRLNSSPTTLMTTKKDILDSATRLFAEYGFRDASVREICNDANANLAAINYHFGNKTQLYVQVIQIAYQSLGEQSPMPMLDNFDSAIDALDAWIKWYIERLFGEGSEITNRLLLREAANPSPMLDEIVSTQMFPLYQQLDLIVRALHDEDASNADIKLSCLSILGQCLVHRTNKSMIDRLPIEPKDLTTDIDRLAKHISKSAHAMLTQSHRAPSSESRT